MVRHTFVTDSSTGEIKVVTSCEMPEAEQTGYTDEGLEVHIVDLEDLFDISIVDHYKWDSGSGTLVKKSDEDITTIEEEKAANDPAIQRATLLQAQSDIVNDETKTDGEKFAAVITILKEYGIIIKEV